MLEKVLNFFSGGIIKDVGEAIDRNVTSDEERLTLHNEMAQIVAMAEGKALEFAAVVEQAITARHAADMQSDSWLAKNIRPIVLIVMTLFTILYLLLGLYSNLDQYNLEFYKAGLAMLGSLDGFIYGFYFGSRGLEKGMKSIATIVAKRQDHGS